MIFGTPITTDVLRLMSKYKNKKEITSKDRSDVAVDEQNTHYAEARLRLDQLKSDYGNGITVMIAVYNATGGDVKVNFTNDWHGHYYKDSPDELIHNGQWSAFMHVHTSGAAVGSEGAVIYRTEEVTDIFAGWLNPWLGSARCYCESQEKDHWWNVGSESYMEWKISGSGYRDSSEGHGYKVAMNMADSTTSDLQIVLTKL